MSGAHQGFDVWTSDWEDICVRRFLEFQVWGLFKGGNEDQKRQWSFTDNLLSTYSADREIVQLTVKFCFRSPPRSQPFINYDNHRQEHRRSLHLIKYRLSSIWISAVRTILSATWRWPVLRLLLLIISHQPVLVDAPTSNLKKRELWSFANRFTKLPSESSLSTRLLLSFVIIRMDVSFCEYRVGCWNGWGSAVQTFKRSSSSLG